jgi:hypothetical protein
MILQTSNSEQFARLLDSLAADVLDAGYHLQLRIGLASAAREYRRELNQHRAFWHLTLNAQTAAVMAHLCRAYDQNQNSLSLLNLLETIRDNIHLFGGSPGSRLPAVVNPAAPKPDTTTLLQDRQSVSPKDPLVARLVSLRGNLFAPRNAMNVVEELGLAARFAMTFEEVEELWRRGLSILNRYSQLFRHGPWASSLVGQDDYKELLQSLRRDMRHRETLASEEQRPPESASPSG